MLNNKVKVNKLNSEDVISTSGVDSASYTCNTSPYHLVVEEVNSSDDEKVFLYNSSNGLFTGNPYNPYSSDVPEELVGYGEFDGSYFSVELGDATKGEVYYFTGSGWAKCEGDFNSHRSN